MTSAVWSIQTYVLQSLLRSGLWLSPFSAKVSCFAALHDDLCFLNENESETPSPEKLYQGLTLRTRGQQSVASADQYRLQTFYCT